METVGIQPTTDRLQAVLATLGTCAPLGAIITLELSATIINNRGYVEGKNVLALYL